MKEQSTAAKVYVCVYVCFFCTFILGMGALSINQTTKRLIRNMNLVHSGAKTQGNVIDYKQTTNSKGGTIWPVVTFMTAKGETVAFESLYHPNVSGYSMGETVPVIYDPRKPDIAEINEPDRLWGGIVKEYLFCAAFVAVSCGIIFFSVYRWRKGS
jgi:hypothetical protein